MLPLALPLLLATQSISGGWTPSAGVAVLQVEVMAVGRISVEGRVSRVRHCSLGDLQVWATAHDLSSIHVSISRGASSGSSLKSATLLADATLVGVLCRPVPTIVLSRRQGTVLQEIYIRDGGFHEGSTYTSTSAGRSLLGLVASGAGFLVFGGEDDGRATFGVVDRQAKSVAWNHPSAIKGIVSELLPGSSETSWIGVSRVQALQGQGSTSVFSIGFERGSSRLIGRPLAVDLESSSAWATCGPGCVLVVPASTPQTPQQIPRLFREDGTGQVLPTAPVGTQIISTVPVIVAGSLCLLDVSVDTVGCRGGGKVRVAEPGEYVLSSVVVQAHGDLLRVRGVVRNLTSRLGRESLLLSATLRVKR